MTNEIITNFPAVIATGQSIIMTPQWNWHHVAISGGGSIVTLRWLMLEVPAAWQWWQSNGGWLGIKAKFIGQAPKP